MTNNLTFDPGSFMNPQITKWLMSLSRATSVIVVCVALLVLVGWAFKIEELKRVSENLVAMNPLTAKCFILAGICLWLQKEPSEKHFLLCRTLAGFVAIIGFTKLLSLLLGFDFMLDSILFREHLYEHDRGYYNRMAPNTAFCFMLAGLALFSIDVELKKRRRPAQFLCIAITIVSLLSIYGYIYGVKYLIGVAAFIPMALHTALLFLFLSMGILFARPDKGTMAIIFGSEETGEALFTRFFAIVFPLILGWLKLRGERVGYFSSEFGTALFAISTYAFTMFLIGRNAVMKYRVRKQRQQTLFLLQEDAKKLQSILDNNSSLIYIKNLSGKFEQVNKQFERVFKVSSKDILGKTEYDIFSKDVADRIKETDKTVLATGDTKYLEEVYRLGKIDRTYLTVKFVLRDTEGEKYGLCSISTDITDRKLMEMLLRDSERRLNAILSGMGEGVVVVDTSGRFIFYNEVAVEILGLGITDTPIHEWSKVYGSFLPDGKTHYPTEELPLAKGLRGESTNDVEIFVRNENIPDGRAIKVTGRPIYNDKNEIIASVVVCHDITHEKHLEHLVQENEYRLKAIMSTIGEGIIVADKRGKFVLFNKKAEEILGVGLEELSAAEWSGRYSIYLPDGITKFPPEELPLAKALRGEATDNIELCVRNDRFPKGKIINVSGRPIFDEEGKVTAGVVDFRDLTEVKHLENALEEIKEKYRELISNNRYRRGWKD